MRERWGVPAGAVRLDEIDQRSTDGAPGDRKETEAATSELLEELRELQRRLWAESEQSLLVVLQAMDAGGKDSTIKRVFGALNPQDLHVTPFGPPTSTDLAHDFLWRIHAQTPPAGKIGVFNRSHYEDVVTVRVMGLAPPEVWSERYPLIRSFEALLAHRRTRVVKLFLHISKEEQRERLQERLDDPTKRWKFRPEDLDQRMLWDEFRDAYQDAIEETSTPDAPWYVVPSDRKWFRDFVVATIVTETLREMDPQYPPAPELGSLTVE